MAGPAFALTSFSWAGPGFFRRDTIENIRESCPAVVSHAIDHGVTQADRMKQYKTMFYVYILRSIPYPNKTYTGYTTNLKQRLTEHNSGNSAHTAKYKPWRIDVYLAFTEETKAIAFEKYLKSGSGRVFSSKRF